jgi:hypothetical protein
MILAAGQADRSGPSCPRRRKVVYVGSAGSPGQLFRSTTRDATHGFGAPPVSAREFAVAVPPGARALGSSLCASGA